MLPMFDKKKAVTTIMARLGKPDVHAATETEVPESNLPPGLHDAALDLMHAFEKKSPIDIAKALHSAFEICDAAPHEEGPHEELTEGEE